MKVRKSSFEVFAHGLISVSCSVFPHFVPTQSCPLIFKVLTGNHSTVIFPTLSPHIKCNVGVAMCAAPKNHSWAAGEAGSCRRELLRSQSWSVQGGT